MPKRGLVLLSSRRRSREGDYGAIAPNKNIGARVFSRPPNKKTSDSKSNEMNFFLKIYGATLTAGREHDRGECSLQSPSHSPCQKWIDTTAVKIARLR